MIQQERTGSDSPFAETTVPLSRAHHAPGYIYTSPDVLQREKELIFLRDWLCVGRYEEVENPGDYMALRVLEEPVVIVNSGSGKIKAFANICMHRGAEIASGCGNAKSLICPFHCWSYDLDGKLIGAPYMRDVDNFSMDSCRLPEIRLELWHNWIFICFDSNARPLSERVAHIDRDFGYLRQDDCRLAVKSVVDLKCNWKLIVENLADFYHLNTVHVTTNGRRFTKDAYRFAPGEDGSYVISYNSGPSTMSGEPVFGKMPWLADKPDDFSVETFVPPNFTFFARIDDVHPTITWPLSATTSRIIVYTLLPKQYFDEPDFKERSSAYKTYQSQLMSEDQEMLESVQRNLASNLYRPGRMAPLESGVHHILTNYLRRLE